ncbi:MAG TPA: pyrroline-5-carboxylate reductase [Thermotogota bacterium]|nr:pyrroline-5-carboxylate reductase [Thermotogota bacterium]HRW93327.1 pyrroline-5-carboxylate reductase [Thermotogota bacterium]HRW93350.1 pyrroline-5-carboxylate reductase [Thermotogota bacterium]
MQIGIIGVGNVGSILAEKFSGNGHSLFLLDRDPAKTASFESMGAVACSSSAQLLENSQLIFVSVKPQDSHTLLLNMGMEIQDTPEKTIISTMAGVSIHEIREKVGIGRIIRIMPNLPIKVGHGVVAITFAKDIPHHEREEIEQILSLLGKVVEVDEKDIDKLTAVTGSGPAFVAYFLESMLEGAINIGLRYDLARELIEKTFSGTLELLEAQNQEPSLLKYAVASPGGVTVKGLQTLDENAVKGSIVKAVVDTYHKSQQMG